jgi:ring-1,2-phenylacetyl-CoA epoxidase subunit PaaC
MEKKIQTNKTSKVPPSEITEQSESYERSSREAYILHLADNSLIIGQRNSEWCGHGPVLEQDIAITNISLDLIGQARNFYQYAAVLIGGGASEDSLAYLRKEREYKNCLLVEQPNSDWAQTILRQFLFSQFQYLLFQQLQNSKDEQIAAIAAKSLKEVAYHLRWSREWVIRLGDGTEESHSRMLKAIDELWRYTGELFIPSDYEKESGVEFEKLKDEWNLKVKEIFNEATLLIPEKIFFQTGGKTGIHTEHLGYILTELQYMQRTYPDSEW